MTFLPERFRSAAAPDNKDDLEFKSLSRQMRRKAWADFVADLEKEYLAFIKREKRRLERGGASTCWVRS